MQKKLNTLIITGFLLTGSLFAGSFVFAEEETEYRFERMWPRVVEPWYFNSSSDIAITPDGSVYVTDVGNDRVQQLVVLQCE